MNTTTKVAGALAALLIMGSWLPDGRDDSVPAADARAAASSAAPAGPSLPPTAAADSGTAQPGAAPASAPASAALVSSRPERRQTPVGSDLLQAGPHGDGDSWRDTAGREYRLGLVNAPESNECFGPEATAKRKELVAAGFHAEIYTRDRYGRNVSVVTTADGRNVNVLLARHGFANDRYLSSYRHENPALAEQLDRAFAAAKAERAGLWGACAKPAAAQGNAAPPPAPEQPPQAAAGSCHPDYVTCIPVKGDGSGRGDANDLDCPDIGKRVQLRSVGVDPYRLDADRNGYGCE